MKKTLPSKLFIWTFARFGADRSTEDHHSQGKEAQQQSVIRTLIRAHSTSTWVVELSILSRQSKNEWRNIARWLPLHKFYSSENASHFAGLCGKMKIVLPCQSRVVCVCAVEMMRWAAPINPWIPKTEMPVPITACLSRRVWWLWHFWRFKSRRVSRKVILGRTSCCHRKQIEAERVQATWNTHRSYTYTTYSSWFVQFQPSIHRT